VLQLPWVRGGRSGARRSVRAGVVAVVATAGLAVVAGPAWADAQRGASAEQSADAQYYRASVVAIEPAVAGLTVTVDGPSVSLENRSSTQIVVLGLAGEPYLRFTPQGVDENVTALSAELNAGRAPRAQQGKPVVTWTHRTDEPRYEWRDLRVQWMPKQRPPIVTADEHAQHRVLDWALQLTADGKPTLVRGAVDWTGTPRFGTSTYLLFAAAALLGVGAVFWLRRRRGPRSGSGSGVGQDFDEQPGSVLVGALPDLAELAVRTGRAHPDDLADLTDRADPADPYAAFRSGAPAAMPVAAPVTAPAELSRRAARRTR
jgi:hypothetical protein